MLIAELLTVRRKIFTTYNLFSFYRTMSFPTKSERDKCWNSRDDLWKCLNENPESPVSCGKFREAYISSCPTQWVKHFDRKREYLKFKDQIQNNGKSGNQIEKETSLALKSAEDSSQSQNPDQPQNKSHNQLTVPDAGLQSDINVDADSLANSPLSKSPTKTRVFRKFQPWTFS